MAAIPKRIKRFLFNGIKSDDSFIELEKALGQEINELNIVITPERSYFLFPGDDEFEDFEKDLTDKELDTFMGYINMNRKKLVDNKHIFINADFKTLAITFQQTKLDGKEINMTL